MKYILYGHRGTGKTSLLKRLKNNLQLPTFDLDEVIANKYEKTISEIFGQFGESHFRKLEIQELVLLDQTYSSYVIAVGGGFPFENLPSNVSNQIQNIWVRRSTDKLGRIFLNRPRILPDLRPLDESIELFQSRDPKFSRSANWVYDMPEGEWINQDLEMSILFGNLPKSIGNHLAYVTLLPEHLQFKKRLKALAHEQSFIFEFRNDLLSKEQALNFAEFIPTEIRLMSLRKKNSWVIPAAEVDSDHMDYSIESNIVSFHSRDDKIPISEWLNQVHLKFGHKHHLKIAIPIDSFADLLTLWQWQQERPLHRSVLPMSKDGRWQWFRLWQKRRQKINFLKIGSGSATDQPSLYDWFNGPDLGSQFFAAVLGEPVNHSWSPARHANFFKHHQMPFLKISLSRQNFSEGMMVLQKLGLKAAAVTSPLKELAYSFCQHLSEAAQTYQSVNTLLIDESGLAHGHNTDIDGTLEAIKFLDLSSKTLIWGGGGTLNMLKSCLKDFQHLSTRSPHSEVLQWFSEQKTQDINVVWAGTPTSEMPTVDSKVKKVLDLNYHSYSYAREYASLLNSCEFQDGKSMFDIQAQEQQYFWKGKL